MQSTESNFPSGLRLTLWFSVVGGLVFALTSLVVPDLVASLSGLPGKDLPVYLQAGGAILGFTIGSFLCLRATRWSQIRISMISLATFSLLSSLGAFYYVILKGVTTPALIVVLIYSIILTAALAYYFFALDKRKEG